MPAGPLPSPDARRRNQPTIPTTKLPVSGRKGRPPKVPTSYELGKHGRDWWKWAWATPQATAWDAGALYTIARRAQLEDELAALRKVDGGLDLAAALQADEEDVEERIGWLIRSLKSHAAGSTTVMKEMRELDKALGLNPAAMAALRWTIVDDTAAAATKTAASSKAKPASGVRRLRVVDPEAATAS